MNQLDEILTGAFLDIHREHLWKLLHIWHFLVIENLLYDTETCPVSNARASYKYLVYFIFNKVKYDLIFL